MTWFTEAMCCPQTGAKLVREGDDMVAEESAQPRYAYPIVDGVPILLKDHARLV